MNTGHTRHKSWGSTLLYAPNFTHWFFIIVLVFFLFVPGSLSIVVSSSDSISLQFRIPMNSILGWTLLLASVAIFVQVYVTRMLLGFFLTLTLGLIYLAYGSCYLLYPVSGLETALKLLVGFLSCSGAVKLLLATKLYPRNGWERIAFNGYASWILSFFLLVFNAITIKWVLGFILGFDLIFYAGWLLQLYSLSYSIRHNQLHKNEYSPLKIFQCENNVIYYNFTRD